SSCYCVLDESGRIVMEQKVSTTAKALQAAFGVMPRSRIALETGMRSPWVSRLLSQLGHEVIVAHARNVRLIGESRKKDDRLDAQTLARLARIDPQLLCPVKHRSAKAQADLSVIRARAGLVRARRALVNTARGLAKSYGERLRGCNVRQHESRESRRAEFRTAIRAAAVVGGTAVAERTDSRIQGTDRETGAGQLSTSRTAEADQGRRHVDRIDVLAHTGRPASLSREPRRRLLSRAAARAVKLRAERTADAHQQRWRSLFANPAGARRSAYLGTVRRGCDLRRWGLKLAEPGGR